MYKGAAARPATATYELQNHQDQNSTSLDLLNQGCFSVPSLVLMTAMPPSSSKSSPKPSEVAAEAKRHYIPLIRKEYASRWPTCSYIYHQPLAQISFLDRALDLSPPHFCERGPP